MDDTNNLPATVRIMDRPYKLRIGAEDEQFLRQAASLIDSQAKEYGRMYAYNDRQDLLAMVALTQITRLLKLQHQQQYRDTRMEDKLTQINQLLDTKVER